MFSLKRDFCFKAEGVGTFVGASGENISLLTPKPQAAAKGACCLWARGISPHRPCASVYLQRDFAFLCGHRGADKGLLVGQKDKMPQAGGNAAKPQHPSSASADGRAACSAAKSAVKLGGNRARDSVLAPGDLLFKGRVGLDPPQNGKQGLTVWVLPPPDITIASVGRNGVSHGTALVPNQGVGSPGMGCAGWGPRQWLGLGSPTGFFPPRNQLTHSEKRHLFLCPPAHISPHLMPVSA